jgi:hypothetical protein
MQSLLLIADNDKTTTMLNTMCSEHETLLLTFILPPVTFLQMRFVRLILDEGGSSTGKAEKTRHALMIQSIHADSKVLVDATPYDQGNSHRSNLRKLRELGATWTFFSSTRNYDAFETQWENRVVQAKEGAELATQIVQQVSCSINTVR